MKFQWGKPEPEPEPNTEIRFHKYNADIDVLLELAQTQGLVVPIGIITWKQKSGNWRNTCLNAQFKNNRWLITNNDANDGMCGHEGQTFDEVVELLKDSLKWQNL